MTSAVTAAPLFPGLRISVTPVRPSPLTPLARFRSPSCSIPSPAHRCPGEHGDSLCLQGGKGRAAEGEREGSAPIRRDANLKRRMVAGGVAPAGGAALPGGGDGGR